MLIKQRLHIYLFYDDPELIQPIQDKIRNDKVNAATGLDDNDTIYFYFESMDKIHMKERAADIRDVLNVYWLIF